MEGRICLGLAVDNFPHGNTELQIDSRLSNYDTSLAFVTFCTLLILRSQWLSSTRSQLYFIMTVSRLLKPYHGVTVSKSTKTTSGHGHLEIENGGGPPQSECDAGTGVLRVCSGFFDPSTYKKAHSDDADS